MTYSIVARDEHSGELGVAVQTCMFAVGSTVPWARAGVGAVATQAMGDPAYGPRCLEHLATGATAPEALTAAWEADPLASIRQVGVVGANGTAAAATGELCIDHAGHVVGDGFAVQANMMSTPEVWPAMASAFTGSSGPLAHRLLAALVAGEAAGGDARGRMSAALLVVEGLPAAQPGSGTVVDLRVDRSEDPLGDLAKLLVAGDAFAGFHSAFDHLLGGDAASALAALDGALGTLPGDRNMRFLRAGALAGSGNIDAAMTELRALVAEHPTFEVIIRSFVAKGLMALPDGVSIDLVLGRG
jgi:uncharacterized Ntn-hydrolase superfamily protein